MDQNTTYLMQLYRLLLEHEDNKVVSTLLTLLSRRLPPSEIERLRAEIADPKTQIRKRAFKRKIKYLVHFTHAANVASILEHGLIPRQQFAAMLRRGYDNVKLTDRWRHDAHLDASCLSISFPNYRMFFHYLKRFPEAAWAVLQIDPAVLWQIDCAFYATNAASKRMSNTPVDSLKTISAFDALFQDYKDEHTYVKRSDLCLPNNLPTNPQAEVLAFDIIPPELILAVCLPRISDYSIHYHSAWHGVHVVIEPDYFGPRSDYKVWSNAYRVQDES